MRSKAGETFVIAQFLSLAFLFVDKGPILYLLVITNYLENSINQLTLIAFK